jgi:hypothetical protein
MSRLAAYGAIIVFAALASIHLFWALGGRSGKLAAVPEISGRPAFAPSATATFAVAAGLVACGLLVAASAGLVGPPSPSAWVTWSAFALSLALLARAIGDFRLLGFFKRVRGTAFARLDSLVYAPLCLFLGVTVFYVAAVHRGT